MYHPPSYSCPTMPGPMLYCSMTAESVPMYSCSPPGRDSGNYALGCESAQGSPSFLEYAVINNIYSDKKPESSTHKIIPQSQYIFTPGDFLRPNRDTTCFIGAADDIRHYIQEAFKLSTGKNIPSDISITICPIEDMARIFDSFGGRFKPGIQGFAINRRKQGERSEIFIKEGDLAEVMLTIGHELGHVISDTLDNARDEEAKAFAFSMHWMDMIRENNIADLKDSISAEAPAENGLHDRAYAFVRQMVVAGQKAIDVFFGIISGRLSTCIETQLIYSSV